MCIFVIYIEFFPYCLFVSNSQVIGCEDHLQNDLYCVRWGVKLYLIQSMLFTMQKQYESRLVIKLSQSSHRIVILCRGEAVEPQIEFDRPLVEFDPILPHTPADEKEFIVRNPCKFPVEIYNLEFDKIYLEEENVSLLIEAKHVLYII